MDNIISQIKIGNTLYNIKDESAISSSDVTTAINGALEQAEVAYKSVKYNTTHITGNGALTIPGTEPVYVITVSGNVSSVTLQNNPTYGHSCHAIFKSADSSSYTVFIGNDNTDRICPTTAGVSLTVPASGQGYAEVDFINAGDTNTGNEIYVRGL